MGNSKSADKLINAGDIVIEDIRIVSYNGLEVNIRKMLAAFVLYEDIYSNGLSGHILITDSLNLAKNVPLIGQEELFLSFYTPGVDNKVRRVRLKIFKISSQLHGEEGKATTLLKLEFVSPLVHLSNMMKLNRVMGPMPYSDMVQAIYKDLTLLDPKLPNLLVEPTMGNAVAMIPNWNPLYAINWMGYRSVSAEDDMACDFMFYETLDGYRFRSLTMLKYQDPVCVYKNIPAGFRNKDTGERMLEAELRSIMNHTIADVHDRLRETSMGMMSSTQLVHEMTTKSYYTSNYSYRDYFQKAARLNANRVIPYDSEAQDSPTAYMKYHVKNFHLYDGVIDQANVDRALYRQAQLNLMNTFVMSIRVFGDSTLRVGDVIEVEFASPEDKAKTGEETDRYLSGRYMVMCICHEYKEGIHEMLLTIARDSLNEPIPDRKDKDIVVP